MNELNQWNVKIADYVEFTYPTHHREWLLTYLIQDLKIWTLVHRMSIKIKLPSSYKNHMPTAYMYTYSYDRILMSSFWWFFNFEPASFYLYLTFHFFWRNWWILKIKELPPTYMKLLYIINYFPKSESTVYSHNSRQFHFVSYLITEPHFRKIGQNQTKQAFQV